MQTPLEMLAVLALRSEWVEKATEQDAEDIFEVGAEFVPLEVLLLLAHKFPGITFRHAKDVPKQILQPVCRANARLAMQHRLTSELEIPVVHAQLRQEPELLYYLMDGLELDTYLSEDLARELAVSDPLTVLRRSPQRLRSKDVTELAVRVLEEQHRVRGYESVAWSSFALSPIGNTANNNLWLFSVPLGQQGQGWPDALSIERTNLREGNRIFSSRGFYVEAVQYTLENATEDQARDIARSCLLRWDFVQTNIDIGVLSDFSDRGTAIRGTRYYPKHTPKQRQHPDTFMQRGQGSPVIPANSTFGVVANLGTHAPTLPSMPKDKIVALRVTLLGHSE